MGIWIEVGVFCLVFVFALHQFHDLKKEKQKREQQKIDASLNAGSGDKDLEEFCGSDGRVCPLPVYWVRLWEIIAKASPDK